MDNVTSHGQDNQTLVDEKYDGRKVRLCVDGKYRWTYPMSMLKNPVLFLTVFKVIGGIMAAILVFVICLSHWKDITSGNFKIIFHDLRMFGYIMLGCLVITIVAFLIVAAQYGWNYIIRFTMDEDGFLHEQIPAQKKIARKLGKTVAATGALTGSLGRVGQGMLVANHTSLASDFKVVRKVKPLRKWNTIKVNEPFAKNQIYCDSEDFDFVLNYILEHCPKLKE
ncbi:MAG: hypothetical protein J5548_04315 [Prevotella sp.]|nr:hypothetical protein [Prevotella sp.]